MLGWETNPGLTGRQAGVLTIEQQITPVELGLICYYEASSLRKFIHQKKLLKTELLSNYLLEVSYYDLTNLFPYKLSL